MFLNDGYDDAFNADRLVRSILVSQIEKFERTTEKSKRKTERSLLS